MAFHEITIFSNGRARRYNLADLALPSGVLAHKLQPDELYSQLSALGVLGITTNSGRHDLLVAFAKHLAGPEPETPKSLEQQRAALEADRAAFEQHKAAQIRLLQEDREALLKRLRQFDRERGEFAERAND